MAQLIGIARLGRDAELRAMPDGTSVADLNLAFSYGKKDPNTNKKPTQWARGSIWGRRAEAITEHLTKGTMVYVVLDDVHIQTFNKQDGTQGNALAGRVSTIEFASRPEAAQTPPPQQTPPQQRAAPAQQPAANIYDLESDVPF